MSRRRQLSPSVASSQARAAFISSASRRIRRHRVRRRHELSTTRPCLRQARTRSSRTGCSHRCRRRTCMILRRTTSRRRPCPRSLCHHRALSRGLARCKSSRRVRTNRAIRSRTAMTSMPCWPRSPKKTPSTSCCKRTDWASHAALRCAASCRRKLRARSHRPPSVCLSTYRRCRAGVRSR